MLGESITRLRSKPSTSIPSTACRIMKMPAADKACRWAGNRLKNRPQAFVARKSGEQFGEAPGL
jgi:hypothetical protein